jgi:hypothetical protein
MAEKRRLREIGKTILIIVLGIIVCFNANTKIKELVARDALIDSLNKVQSEHLKYLNGLNRELIKLVKDTTYSHQKLRNYEKRTLKSR